MAHKSTVAKISVTTDDGKVDLCKIDKNESLETNIKELCRRFSLPSDSIFGLKFVQSNDGKTINTFVTNENYDDIKDGYSLKLTYSLEIYVKRIFDNMCNIGRPQSFEDLYKLCSDPAFINEMVRLAKIEDFMELFANKLDDRELIICLFTLLNLLKRNCVSYLPPEILYKIINIIKSGDSKPDQLQPALAVLCQILFLRGSDFHPFKQEIINKIRISDLMPIIISGGDQKNLLLNTLMLINTIVKSVKGEKRLVLIKELNLKQNRDIIFRYVIDGKRNMDAGIAHELYVYQTLILSLYKDALDTYVDPTNSALFNKEDYELNEQDDNVHNLFDFQDLLEKSRQNSLETLVNDVENLRLSLLSSSTRESIATINSSVSDYTDSWDGIYKLRISHLTLENLRYFKGRHPKNFKKSLLEETAYEPGIYVTSEEITQILASLFNMGKAPDKHSQKYQPLVFNTRLKFPFFPEVFSRTMWLLSKTRCEMKASTKEDYPKVLQVLKKQLEMIFEMKPMDYKQLTNGLHAITYQEAAKKWQEEKNQEWNVMLATNPSVLEFKKRVIIENEKLICEQRIRVLQRGEKFPKLPQKKGKLGYIFVKLSDNKRKVQWCDWDFEETDLSKVKYNALDVQSIRHLIVGKACPHIKDHTKSIFSAKDHTRAFTLLADDDTTINFFAKDVKIASYWIDGFNILLEKDNKSDVYKEELDSLVNMDCNLQLLELQEVEIPCFPPPVPPLPPGCGPKPALPPKSEHLLQLQKNKIYDRPKHI